MKVVLFCGGMGLRLRDYSQDVPKPMVKLGNRPILWNIMRYYAHYGHKEFILCLGYKSDMIKEYFINYHEYTSNDFVLTKGGKHVEMISKDISQWKITFVDTGFSSNIGERLMKVKQFLKDDAIFLANYSDGLTNLPLDTMLQEFTSSGKLAAFMAYQPTQSFHVVSLDEQTRIVNSISHIGQSGLWINAGYFILRKEIFNFMQQGEELVNEPFQRLIEKKELYSYPYRGFWASMDTFKDKQLLDDIHAKGNPPWEIWKTEVKHF
jgi:glucose-1-phosphate cytidylyltransferase